jgi:hypothetical protein
MAETPSSRTAIFVFIPDAISERLNNLVREKFGKASYSLPRGNWLIAYQGTSQQLTEELQITGVGDASGIIMSISSYWGRTNPAVWEWLKQYIS